MYGFESNGEIYRHSRSLMHCQQIYVTRNTCATAITIAAITSSMLNALSNTMWIDLYPEEQNERHTMLHFNSHCDIQRYSPVGCRDLLIL